jgi:hypothetical protein
MPLSVLVIRPLRDKLVTEESNAVTKSREMRLSKLNLSFGYGASHSIGKAPVGPTGSEPDWH